MRALIVGGGIGGLTAARALTRAGIEVAEFERAQSLDQVQVGGAIHVWHNGMRGLQELELGEEVAALGGRGAVVETAEMRNSRGRLITSWSPGEMERELGAPTLGVVRPELHRVLVGGVEDGVLQLGKECVGFEQRPAGVTARFSDGSEESGDVLIGADGLDSAVRRQLHGEEPPRFARYASWQALTEFEDDAAPVGLFRIIWGSGARFLYYRVSAERVYWEGIFATEAGGSDPPGQRKSAVLERFGDWFHPVPAIVESTAEDAISRHDVYDRPRLKTWGTGRVTLLGDAAHPMTNAAGQGANQAIEDAVVIGKTMAGADDPQEALRAYERRRMRRSARVAGLAWNLTALSRWQSPAACAFRDRLLTAMFALVAKRAQRKDMAYEF
jgi:2-polyprenyl-6-methoxyphenol hydroxylase-like FAD-dependent oxidoreductase